MMGFLTSNLKLTAACAAVFALTSLSACQATKLYNRSQTIKAAERTITTVTRERDACLKDLGALSSAVDHQNAAVADYRAESERRLSEATKAVQAAQAAAVGAKKRAAAVLAGRPAAPSCETAFAVLRGEEG